MSCVLNDHTQKLQNQYVLISQEIGAYAQLAEMTSTILLITTVVLGVFASGAFLIPLSLSFILAAGILFFAKDIQVFSDQAEKICKDSLNFVDFQNAVNAGDKTQARFEIANNLGDACKGTFVVGPLFTALLKRKITQHVRIA